MIIQNGQIRFWSFLLWRIFILLSHTTIFQRVLFLGLIWLVGCISLSDLLNPMDVLSIYFWTISGIDVVNFERLFLQDSVELYHENNWKCIRKNNSVFCGCNCNDDVKGDDDIHWCIWYSELNFLNHRWSILTWSGIYIIFIVNVTCFYPKRYSRCEYFCIWRQWRT